MSSSSSPPAGSSSSSSRGRADQRPRERHPLLDRRRAGCPGSRSAASATPRSSSAASASARSRRSSRSERGSPSSAEATPGAGLALGPDHHVLDRRQPGEQADALQRAGDPEPGELVRANPVQHGLAEPHAAGVGAHEAADDVEQRRLARAVGADDADDLAGRDRQRDVVERRQAAEAHRETVHPQHLRRFVARGGALIVAVRQSSAVLVCVGDTIGRRRKEER